MKYRLGLDVGTASIGLVALELDDGNRPIGVVWHSVRIFDEPLLPPKSAGVGETKKSARRLARQQMRQYERRARRLKRIASMATLLGLDPKNIPWGMSRHIHHMRATAAYSEITLDDLLLVFLQMSKRRGYAGGFKIKKDQDAGVVESGVKALKVAMKENECRTLGEYLWWRIRNKQHLRLKDDKLFADRAMVENEFNLIWEVQEEHHPVLKECHRGKSLREHFYRAIVEQRPLKSPAAAVGNCLLEPMLPRAPMAQPLVQAFRIEKQIADLRWGMGRKAPKLSEKQKAAIRKQLSSKGEVKFSSLYKALEKADCPDPAGREFNLVRGDREALTGDRTTAAMKKLGLLEEWQTLREGYQRSVINLLAEMGSPEVFDVPGWEKNLQGTRKQTRHINPEISGFINKMVSSGKFDRLSAMGFDAGRASYSLKALSRLIPVMQEHEMDEYDAVVAAYPSFGETSTNRSATGNVTVDVALRQLHREVGRAINVLGTDPSEIIIELTRDMRVGLKKRKKINEKMRDNEKRRKHAATEIKEHTGVPATESQIRRYLLWEEQDKEYCPYCNNTIGISDAINGATTEYEHILPRRITRIGKKKDFLVLAHKSCNQDKGGETPWDKWGNTDRWDIIMRHAEKLKKKNKGKARQLLTKDLETDSLSDDVISDFTDRQFHESAWIAKVCIERMRSICPNVSVSRGLLTAHLRRVWKLDTVIPQIRYEEGMPVFDEDYQPNKKEASQIGCRIAEEDFEKYREYWEGHRGNNIARPGRRINKRIDHRHHLIDALVISLTTRSLYQHMARHYKQVSNANEKKLKLYAEPELKDIRLTALRLVRECRPTHQPDRWSSGNMFMDNPNTIIDQGGKRLKVDEFKAKIRDNQKVLYAHRKRLADLIGSAKTIEKVREKFEKIVAESTRMMICTEFEKRINAGASLKEALAPENPIIHPHRGTPIRRVLVSGKDASEAIPVLHCNRKGHTLHKYLEPSGYAYLEFQRNDPNAEIRLVRLCQISKETKRENLEVVRFYKGDTVRDPNDGKFYVIRQIKAAGPSLIMSPITEAVANVGIVLTPRQKKISKQKIKKLILVEVESDSS